MSAPLLASLLAVLACEPPPDAEGGEADGAAPPPEQAAQAEPAGGKCVDATLQEELLAKRKYRLTKERLFVKKLRHELTLTGGYYVSDLFDSTFHLGGSYTFFAAENFGTELSVGWSRLRTTTADTVETANDFDLPLGENRDDLIRTFGTLLWSPLYGKMRFGGTILRYDFYVGAGPGVVIDPVSYGLAGNFTAGVRIFFHQAIALRLEARDYLYNQGLLRENYVVNDLAFNLGFSVFLPLKN